MKRSRRFYPLIGLAAAAAIAVVFIRPGDVNQVNAPISTERRGIADEPQQIVLVSPVDAGEMKELYISLFILLFALNFLRVAKRDPAATSLQGNPS